MGNMAALVFRPSGTRARKLALAMHEAEVGRHGGKHGMQPDVVPEQRDQAEGGPQARNEPRDGEHGVDDRYPLGVGARTPVATVGGDTPGTEQEMDDVVQQVHREQAHEVAEAGVDMQVRMRVRRREEARDEAPAPTTRNTIP